MEWFNKSTVAALSGLMWVCSYAPPVQSAPPVEEPALEARVTKMERLLNSSTLVDLLNRVELLQREVQELRGEIEQKAYTLDQLKQRQRELYLDVDRRLRRVETGDVGIAPSPAGLLPEQPVSVQPATPVTPPREGPPAIAPATMPATPAAEPELAVDPAKEQAAYQEAFNLLKEGRYNRAVNVFQKFLAAYPEGRYGDNAQYWLGEAYYVTRQFAPALEAFTKLIEKYPTSPKRTHALLKMGYIHHELGETDKAKMALEDLMSRHPKTTAARLARERLQRMKMENR